MKTKLFNKKGKEKPDKFFEYLKLTDAFEKEGCPVCRRIAETNFNCIDSLLYENVNDPVTRKKLKASFGFCIKHSELLFKLGDALGSAIIYKDILNLFLKDLNNNSFENFNKKSQCPVCLNEALQLKSDINIFINFLDDEDFINKFKNSDGLCAVHLLNLLNEINSEKHKDYLINFHIKKLKKQIADLDELIRKSDYRFQNENITAAESRSWITAIEYISGKKKNS